MSHPFDPSKHTRGADGKFTDMGAKEKAKNGITSPNIPQQPTQTEEPKTPNITQTYTTFTTLTPTPQPPLTETEQSAHDFLNSNNPLAQEAKLLMPRLTPDQQQAVITQLWEATQKRITRSRTTKEEKTKLLNGPTQEEWDTYCQTQIDRLNDPEKIQTLTPEQREQLTATWEQTKGTTPPNGLTFEGMKRAQYSSIYGQKSLDREARMIAGWHDIPPTDAYNIIQQQRQEWLNTPEDQRPQTPPEFNEALEMSYIGTSTYKKPPMDPATRWALYTTFTNPELTNHLPKNNNGYVVFDTETNGLNSNADIIQITAIAYDTNGNEIERISTLIKPPPRTNEETGEQYTHTGDEKAISIHNITPEKVQNSPTFDQIAPQLRQLMNNRTLVAHNILFDYPKLQSHLAKAGEEPLDNLPMIDTLRMARTLQPRPEGVSTKDHRHNLQTAVERAGLPFDPTLAHDAEYDVDRCNALYRHYHK